MLGRQRICDGISGKISRYTRQVAAIQQLVREPPGVEVINQKLQSIGLGDKTDVFLRVNTNNNGVMISVVGEILAASDLRSI